MIGKVVSVKMQNTVTVLVTGKIKHPLYKKAVTQSKKFLANDFLTTKLGDVVEIVKVAPKSRRKHWQVVKVIGRDIEQIIGEELKEAAAAVIKEAMPEEKTEEKVEKPKKLRKKKEVKSES